MGELDLAHIISAGSLIIVAILSKVVRSDKPNKFVGYRTKRSMLNQETWDMSNDYMSNGLLYLVLTAVTVQIFLYFTIDKVTALLVSTVVFTLGLGGLIFLIEAKLKRHFNPDGSRKSVREF